LSGKETLSAASLQILFCADRAWHVDTVIRPALEAGKTVICDRYVASTIAYGMSQSIDKAWLEALNTTFLRPDCQIFTLPPLAVSLERIARRPNKDLFETQELQKKIHAAYTTLAAADPTIKVIDTSGEKKKVAAEILSHVLKTCNQKPSAS
jgi:dTMP kinase